VEVIADLWLACIDSESDKSNCNKILLEEEENQNNQDDNSKEEDKIEETKVDKIDNNIDTHDNNEVDSNVDKKEKVSTWKNKKLLSSEEIMQRLESHMEDKSKWNLAKKIKLYESMEKLFKDYYDEAKTSYIWPLVREVLNKTRVKILVLKKK